MPIQRMTVPIEWKAEDADKRILTGYASTFGNVDLGGDVVMPGAFTKTIDNIKANGIPLLADHMAMTSSVLGTIYDAREDTKGLVIKARVSEAPSAEDTAIKLREGHLSKLSIGYETMDDAYEERDGLKVRLLKELKLWETSVVVFPMNPQAVIGGMKALAVAASEAGVTAEDMDKAADLTTDPEFVRALKSLPDGPQGPTMTTLDVWTAVMAVEVKSGAPTQDGVPSDVPPAGDKADPPATSGSQPDKPEDKGAGGWDRYRSAALLEGRDTSDADAATRTALATRLALAEGSEFPTV